MPRRPNLYDNRRYSPRRPQRPRTRYSEIVPDRFTAMVGSAPSHVFSREGWRTGRLVAFILLLVFAGMGYWLLNAPNFQISRITITGSRYLSPDMVDATTNVLHQNIFTLREQLIVDDLKSLPFILDVKITKELPNGVRVDVTERQRKLIWRSGGVDYLVDWDGVVLEIGATQAKTTPVTSVPAKPGAASATKALPTLIPSPVPTALPDAESDMAKAVVVEVVNGPPLKIGDKVESAVAVQSAQDLATKLPAYALSYSRLEYASPTGLTVVGPGTGPNGNWRAIFGTSSQFDRKVSILKSLMSSTQKWTTVDLRFPDRPAFK